MAGRCGYVALCRGFEVEGLLSRLVRMKWAAGFEGCWATHNITNAGVSSFSEELDDHS